MPTSRTCATDGPKTKADLRDSDQFGLCGAHYAKSEMEREGYGYLIKGFEIRGALLVDRKTELMMKK